MSWRIAHSIARAPQGWADRPLDASEPRRGVPRRAERIASADEAPASADSPKRHPRADRVATSPPMSCRSRHSIAAAPRRPADRPLDADSPRTAAPNAPERTSTTPAPPHPIGSNVRPDAQRKSDPDRCRERAPPEGQARASPRARVGAFARRRPRGRAARPHARGPLHRPADARGLPRRGRRPAAPPRARPAPGGTRGGRHRRLPRAQRAPAASAPATRCCAGRDAASRAPPAPPTSSRAPAPTSSPSVLPETDTLGALTPVERLMLELEALEVGRDRAPRRSRSASPRSPERRVTVDGPPRRGRAGARRRPPPGRRPRARDRPRRRPQSDDDAGRERRSSRRSPIALLERDRYTGEHSASVVDDARGVARGARDRADGGRAHQGRRAAPRHRQGRDPRRHPAQARPARRRRVDAHARAPRHRRAHPARRHRAWAASRASSATSTSRYDGSGYPDGLAGDEIPIGSRIILACDAYHAMTSDRPYRSAMGHERRRRRAARQRGQAVRPRRRRCLLGRLADTPGGPARPRRSPRRSARSASMSGTARPSAGAPPRATQVHRPVDENVRGTSWWSCPPVARATGPRRTGAAGPASRPQVTALDLDVRRPAARSARRR